MALSSVTTQPINNANQTENVITGYSAGIASLLAATALSVYAAQKTRKQLRKLKRKLTWMLIKQKVKSLFSNVSDRQLIIYILAGVVILALIFIEPIAALVLAIIALILLLTGTI